jgi:hypothetical protein
METLLQDIHQAQTEGILAFDPLSNKNCLIVPILSCLLAENLVLQILYQLTVIQRLRHVGFAS